MSGKGVGARLRRKEDKRHLRGQGQFVSDIRVPGILDVAFIRSPVAHGILKGIDVPAEYAGKVFQASDFPDLKPVVAVPQIDGFKYSEYPSLARERVRFAGEAIAMAIGASRSIAEDIAEEVGLDIEELPAVVDMLAATTPGTPLIREEWGDNVFVEKLVEVGDLESARKNAAVTINRIFRMNRQAGVPMEGRAILAMWDERLDELLVYNSSQFPHQIRAGMAQFLGIEERKLHLIAPDVGGGFGVKNILYPEELMVVALALKLKKPVRWIDDRREHLLSSIHCRDHHHKVTAYADAKGKILGIDVQVHVDAGAYSHWPNSPFLETGMVAKNIPGPYNIRNYRCQSYTVATNKSPIGPFRGVARPAACFTIERTIDEVARAVGREPHIVRMENMITPSEMPYRTVTNLLYDNGNYAESVQRTADLINFDEIRERQKTRQPDGRYIGVGFASFTEQTAHGCGEWVTRGTPVIPGFDSATARMMPDGSLILMVGIQSHGQGLETSLSQIAHQELGIDPLRVSVRHGDTQTSPFGMGTFASRSMVMAGGAVAKACRGLRDKMETIAAYVLKCEKSDLRFDDSMIYGPAGSLQFRDIGRIAHLRQDGLPPGVDPILDYTTTYQPAIDTGVFCYATQAAVVAVDPDTGKVELLDYAAVEDCGTMVNPMIVDGQIAGGIVQGIGTALFEEIPYDENGQPLATTFADYLLPGSMEIPRIKIGHMVTPTPHTEYGMKGMGEGGAISPPAAIANAIRDALMHIGAEINETPMTPKRVRAAITTAMAKKLKTEGAPE
ncbi:xanthine dehydrogenase family protein molybdopterin-binding subunit [Lacisediminimonas sp.]|uniref:xanthine dehydrogenase family protein molybdopterin-binding subunit n=1 Tax=Lacisediminimonas sp. TaxID=3060582 RepID=UPI002720F8D1|nr:xanthine dehydrogenase family protein molybdopterin-binding subunit [Lacisediminimonas sp.]MDO8299187.1 xanthine dehydrogenase family protein molybdopterin-binding subunit [Lacisediminimonas sp.]